MFQKDKISLQTEEIAIKDYVMDTTEATEEVVPEIPLITSEGRRKMSL